MGNYDPNRPDVLGMEWPPLYERDVPLDAGIEYGQTFRSTVAETISTAYTYISATPQDDYRCHLLFNVYEKGKELATGPVQRTLVPVNGGTLTYAATLVGGATIAVCLASPADDAHILMPTDGAIHVEFATAGLFAGKRILRLVLHHSIAVVGDAENPELGLSCWFDEPARVVVAIYGVLQSGRAVLTTDLGEIYPEPPSLTLGTNTERSTWTPADVQSLDTAATRFEIAGAGDGSDRELHYMALEVVWCEENRVAVGAARFSVEGGTGNEVASIGFHDIPLRTPSGAAGWVKPASGEFTVTVGLADTGGPYLDAPGSDMETFGGVPSISLLDSFEVFAPHEGRAIPRGVDNEPRSADAVSALPSIVLTDAFVAASPDTHPYRAQLVAPVYVGVVAVQEITQQASGAARPYPWVRFWARRYGTATDLTVTCDGHTVTITGAQLDALPEIIDGWREVVLRFAVAPTVGTSGVAKQISFSSIANIADRWEILGAIYDGSASATGPTYGGMTAAATHDGARDTTADLAVSLAAAAPVPTGLTATPHSYPVLGFGLDCEVTPSCIPTDIGYVDLLWTGTSVSGTGASGTPVSGFGYYEVQRQDTDPSTVTFQTIAHVTDQTAPRFTDFEARYGIVSTYQVRVVRNDGTEGDWSAPASGTPPAPTGGAAGLLVFTSNVDPTRSVAYGEAFTGAPVEDFGFPEAETRQLQRLYQRDYQTAFRPTERGGTAFSRALLVGSTAHPAAVTVGQSGDSGFDRLRDLAWAPDLPYVCVLDDLGNRWLANVNVPSGSVRRSSGLYVAQAVITEVTATPAAVTDQPPLPAYPGGYTGGY